MSCKSKNTLQTKKEEVTYGFCLFHVLVVHLQFYMGGEIAGGFMAISESSKILS